MFCAGSSKLCQGAFARDSGDLWSALTEFAPALRCHYPGRQVLKSEPKSDALLLSPPRRDLLLWRDGLLSADLGYLRGLL